LAIGTPASLGSAVLASSSTTTVAMTVSASAATGDLVIVDVANDGGANVPSGVVDSAGNTYTADNAGFRDADDYTVRRFSSVITSALTSGVSTITGTVDGGGGTWDKIIVAAKVTGSWDANRIDKTASATGSSTSPDSGVTATTSVADELAYGAMAAGGAPSASGGGPLTAATNSNTRLHNVNGGAFIDLATVYQILTAAGTPKASGTWQASDIWACYVVTYKEASAGSQTINPGHLASGAQLFAPTLAPGSVTVTPGHLASTAQLFAPTFGTQQTVTPDLIAAGSQLFAPALTPGSVTVTPGLLGSGEQVFTPVLEGGDVPESAFSVPSIPTIPTIPTEGRK
jgi:hypothetical protein